MSTYNGEKYIGQQIDSILAQKDVDLSLIIRDDGSKDETVKIIKEYQKKNTNISFYDGGNKGPAMSFIDLIINSGESDYFAFADQDDFWDDTKLINAINVLRELPNNIPTMYYSNLRIVDSELKFYRYSHSEPPVIKNKYGALIDNKATGCTMVFNKKTAEIIKSFPPSNCTMHDAWVFMMCHILGKVVYDKNAYISYRQHNNNVIGTYLKKKSFFDYWKRFKRLFDKSIQPRYNNAVEFYRCYKSLLTPTDKEKVLKIVNYKKNLKSKFKLMRDKDIKATSFSLNFRYRILILLGVI